jgi:hypothetical protein
LKSRENSNMLKEKILQCWCRVIAETNHYDPEVEFGNKRLNENTSRLMEKEQALLQQFQQDSNDKVTHYKVFVGKGNNSVMVRSLFKTRFWFMIHDKEEMDKVNLMWTQCRK